MIVNKVCLITTAIMLALALSGVLFRIKNYGK